MCRSNIDNNLVGNNEFFLEYDDLVIAIGAQVNTFNTPGVAENCHFLKVQLADSVLTSNTKCRSGLDFATNYVSNVSSHAGSGGCTEDSSDCD